MWKHLSITARSLCTLAPHSAPSRAATRTLGKFFSHSENISMVWHTRYCCRRNRCRRLRRRHHFYLTLSPIKQSECVSLFSPALAPPPGLHVCSLGRLLIVVCIFGIRAAPFLRFLLMRSVTSRAGIRIFAFRLSVARSRRRCSQSGGRTVGATASGRRKRKTSVPEEMWKSTIHGERLSHRPTIEPSARYTILLAIFGNRCAQIESGRICADTNHAFVSLVPKIRANLLRQFVGLRDENHCPESISDIRHICDSLGTFSLFFRFCGSALLLPALLSALAARLFRARSAFGSRL